MCVPTTGASFGTIIFDDTPGSTDIRNGFGALTPEDSKCPGFLDVCCKDPRLCPPPAPYCQIPAQVRPQERRWSWRQDQGSLKTSLRVWRVASHVRRPPREASGAGGWLTAASPRPSTSTSAAAPSSLTPGAPPDRGPLRGQV